MKAGVAINPHSSINLLKEVINDLDMVCIMSVNPGFGGQRFIENTYKKIEELDKLRQKIENNFLIEVDGGVNDENYSKLIKSGADVLVAGSFVFNSNEPINTISKLKHI